MTVEEAEGWLLHLELFGVRLGLDRMHRLTTALGLPQLRFASIHVVGSNGKSSTARMTAAILREHGLRTGLYTSPHLRSFAERIEVDGAPVSGEELAGAVADVREATAAVERAAEDPEDRVTQFEALTAAALLALARARVQVAVVEAGLGGRLDATNVIDARVAALTSVSLEHTRWLGDTTPDIAAEKLAVVGERSTLVTGELDPDVEGVVARVAAERAVRWVRAEPADVAGVELGVPGAHQRGNLAVARASAEAFLGRLDDGALRRAASAVRVPGRLEVVDHDPLVVLDGAHNPAGARALAAALPEVVGDRPLCAVLGLLDDKDAAGVLEPLLGLAAHALLTSFSHPRAVTAPLLAERAAALGHAGAVETAPDPRAALERAREWAGPAGAVIVAGSFHLIAELLEAREGARLSTL